MKEQTWQNMDKNCPDDWVEVEPFLCHQTQNEELLVLDFRDNKHVDPKNYVENCDNYAQCYPPQFDSYANTLEYWFLVAIILTLAWPLFYKVFKGLVLNIWKICNSR